VGLFSVSVAFTVGRDTPVGQPVTFAVTFSGGLLEEHELTLPLGTEWTCTRANQFSNTVVCTSAVRADRTLPRLTILTSTWSPKGTWSLTAGLQTSHGTFG